MKIQIRQGVFETNSSSVHTLSISKSKTNFSKIKDSITKITFGPKQECYKNIIYIEIYFKIIIVNFASFVHISMRKF